MFPDASPRLPLIGLLRGFLARAAFLSIAGTGAAAAATVAPTSVDFGGQSMGTTSPAVAVTYTNNGGAPITISSISVTSAQFAQTNACPASLAAGAGCAISVTFKPTAEGAVAGTLAIQSSAGTSNVPLAGTGERSLVTHYYRAILRRAPDAGGKAFWEGEAARVQAQGLNVNEVWFAMAASFFTSAEYLAFARDDVGFVTDLYNTFFNRAPDGGGLSYWTGQISSGMPREVALVAFMFSTEFVNFTQAIFGTATVRAEIDAVTDFYRGLLSRLPDNGGFSFWLGKFRDAQCLGGNAVVTEVESISSLFAGSTEYANRARTNAQYVGDLYNAFLRRGGDLTGVLFWIGRLQDGFLTREQLRAEFVASPEFQARVSAVNAQGCFQAGDYPWPVWTPAIPAVPPSTTGFTYYVDGTNGNNANNGLAPGAAFRTIAKSLTVIAPGDTVLIRAGLYREGINLSTSGAPSGTAAKPITFGSYGDGEVILDGSTRVTGWTQVNGSVWQVTKTFQPVAIVVNEVPLRQVRQGQGGSTAPQEGLAGVTPGSGKWHNGSSVITADFGPVLGSGNPNNADLIVVSNNSVQEHVFFFQHDYIRFKGLTIRGSGNAGIWGYGNNILVESCNIKFNGKAAVDFEFDGTPGRTNADNAVITSRAYHNVLTNWPRGNNGYMEAGGGWPGTLVWSGQLRPLARGNIVHMNGGEGIITYGTNAGRASGAALFERNVAYDNWSINMYFDNQPNNIARNNFLFNHPVENNNFLHVGAYPYDAPGKFTGCLMLADEQGSSDSTNGFANLANSQVTNNIMAGCRFGIRDYSEGASAIANHGLKNTIIANNTIIMPFAPIPNTDTYGIYIQDNGTKNAGSVIQNNVIYGFNNDPLVFSEATGSLPGISLNNNQYFSAGSTPFAAGYNTVQFVNFAGWKSIMTGKDAASSFGDPLLLDVTAFRATGTSAYDYSKANVQAGSPTLGTGAAQAYSPAVNFSLGARPPWNRGAF